jgi:hypothetical protein
MPHYLVSGYLPDNFDPSTQDEAMIEEIHALNREMIAAGVRKFAGGLGSTHTLRPQANGELLLTDGPYLETKEHIGGFWILECADVDEVVAWARKGAKACRFPVEVREIFFVPAPEENWPSRGRTMPKNKIVIKSFALLVVLGMAHQAMAQETRTPYPKMAPIDQYLMADREAEIALARTAAPDSISRDAEVLVLGRHGFETAVKGKNGFVCIVGRSWTSAADEDYWDPKVRVPICVNAAAARTYLLRVRKIVDLALAGQTLAQVNEVTVAALARKELPPMEPGAMCYMMGKQGYGGASAPHWPPHLMFFYSDTDPAIWGANLPGSPIIAVADPLQHLTQFVIPTQRWSDGTEYLPSSTHVHQ